MAHKIAFYLCRKTLPCAFVFEIIASLPEHKGNVCGFVFLRYSLRFCALDYHGNKIEIGIIFCEKFQYLNDII